MSRSYISLIFTLIHPCSVATDEMADGRKRRDGKKKLFPPAVNRARVNYHSSGERDAQKRNARAVARKRTKGNGMAAGWKSDGAGG